MDKKDNSGVLFKNDKKEAHNQPDYKGNITVAGVEYWLSAWIKEGDRKSTRLNSSHSSVSRMPSSA